ncbi:transposase [Qingshengfaniella alkalisoli]|uniref:Transposase n=1 Tax=Qingshengfaniella alkalisoli TaxID=2599296 RepID=A0A5B8IVI2_9RHOB|nr:transposase [Qingshengfaniella alkalisoli]
MARWHVWSILIWRRRDGRLKPDTPEFHRTPRVDDRHVPSMMIFINRDDLYRRDAPKEYGPHNTLYKRWSDRDHVGRLIDHPFCGPFTSTAT